MEDVKITYEEAKKRLSRLFDVIEKTEMYKNPELFHEFLTTYNAVDNYLWEIFHNENTELEETYNNN